MGLDNTQNTCITKGPQWDITQTFEKTAPGVRPVSVAQWANALSEPQCDARPDWLETCDGLGSIPSRGVGFSVGWTNSVHAIRLISRTGRGSACILFKHINWVVPNTGP